MCVCVTVRLCNHSLRVMTKVLGPKLILLKMFGLKN